MSYLKSNYQEPTELQKRIEYAVTGGKGYSQAYAEEVPQKIRDSTAGMLTVLAFMDIDDELRNGSLTEKHALDLVSRINAVLKLKETGLSIDSLSGTCFKEILKNVSYTAAPKTNKDYSPKDKTKNHDERNKNLNGRNKPAPPNIVPQHKDLTGLYRTIISTCILPSFYGKDDDNFRETNHSLGCHPGPFATCQICNPK